MAPIPGRFAWPMPIVRLRSTNYTMKTGLLSAVVGLTISFAPPAFAQQNHAVDAETAQQVRALASSYDAAFNRQDAVTIAGLYTENAVFNTPEGTFHGRKAIEELYAKNYFVEPSTRTIHAEGTYSWVLLHKGGTWRIRESTYDITNMR